MAIDLPETPYSWVVRVWASNPSKLYGIFLSCSLAALAGWLLFHQIVIAMLGFAAIAGATAEFWMPQNYNIDKKGASARCGFSISAITWEEVKRVLPDEKGVKLSPLASEGKSSAFRGVYLRFADNREVVLGLVEMMGQNDA